MGQRTYKKIGWRLFFQIPEIDTGFLPKSFAIVDPVLIFKFSGFNLYYFCFAIRTQILPKDPHSPGNRFSATKTFWGSHPLPSARLGNSITRLDRFPTPESKISLIPCYYNSMPTHKNSCLSGPGFYCNLHVLIPSYIQIGLFIGNAIENHNLIQ